MHQNRQWVLDKYPEGSVLPTVWRLQETVVPELGAREILVQTKWLSMDPYMRGRMSAHANYTSPPGRRYGADYYDERMKATRKV